MRILVTGSRNWDDYHTVARAIGLAISELVSTFGKNFELNTVTVVHGDCETGADAMAKEFVNKIDRSMLKYNIHVNHEPHPAYWDKKCDTHCYHKPSNICLSAGPQRNKKMISLGADICLAFIKNNSPGATGCAKLAEKANIPVRYYRR